MQAGNKKVAFSNFLFYFIASLAIGFGMIGFMITVVLIGTAIATHPLLVIPALIIFVASTFAADKLFNIYRGSVES